MVIPKPAGKVLTKNQSTKVSHTGVNHQALNPMDDKGYLYENYDVWPLKSSVQRRVVAARSVMDLRSVDSSWAFTYSARRKERKTFYKTCGHHTVNPTYENLSVSTYYNPPSLRWDWTGAWYQDHIRRYLHIHTRSCEDVSLCTFNLNDICFGCTWLWVTVQKTQTQCSRHLHGESTLKTV